MKDKCDCPFKDFPTRKKRIILLETKDGSKLQMIVSESVANRIDELCKLQGLDDYKLIIEE